ncbi:LysR family transcriptional regulator [Pseudovibrio ascidiaceicola]|uniref:LysR family transcriptional regulator n=1 Tax=Pseudovibrio ascidiaceicola TaxID=285279 RepID=UPI003D3643B1
MTDRPLDLDPVRTFVKIAELGSFTQAAEALQTTQSTVSLKLKRLEKRLDCQLIERTPRYVQLSAQGMTFLEHARELMKQHDHALASLTNARQRLTIGISDHVAGPELPMLIARMNAQDPELLIEIQIGSSGELLKSFDRQELGTVIVRQHESRGDGKLIANEKFGWFASQDWQPRANEPLPVATMPEPCGVRIMAGHLLDQAHIPWREVFVGGGVTAVSAAVMAGLGVAALARRMLPIGAIEVGEKLTLPDLPTLPIMLHTRVRGGKPEEAITALSAAFKSAVPD